MKDQNKIDEVKSLPEDAMETVQPDAKEDEPVELDAKALARQRSKDDLARKRRDMRHGKGKR